MACSMFLAVAAVDGGPGTASAAGMGARGLVHGDTKTNHAMSGPARALGISGGQPNGQTEGCAK